MEYLLLKWVHILSAILLVGTGLGSAFYKLMADRSGNTQAIAVVMRYVVIADWIFTAPTIVIQPLTGFRLAYLAGLPFGSSWIVGAFTFYLVAFACWLPVVILQIRMRDLANKSVADGQLLPAEYYRMAQLWFYLGIPAFISMLLILYMMVFKQLHP